MCRFLPFSITDFSKNGKLFSVTPKTDGTVQLKSSFSEQVLSRLIKEVETEVVTDRNEPVIKENRKSDFTRSLKLNTVDYKGYTLKLKTTLKTGEILNNEIAFNAGRPQKFTLFSNQKSDYRIMIDNRASASENGQLLSCSIGCRKSAA